MSLRETVSVTCPACQTTYETSVWSTINTDTDPKAAEKLIAGELFDDGCPKCGKVHPLNYPMVFNDPEQMVMISYILDAADYRDKVAEIEELFEDQPQVAPESGYRHRIVTTQNALREKAVIFYNGLDDRLVEMLKVIYSEQVLAQYPNVQFKNVFFLINPKGDWFMQFIADRPLTIRIDKKVYEGLKTQMEKELNLPENEQFTIDMEWAYLKVNEKNKELEKQKIN